MSENDDVMNILASWKVKQTEAAAKGKEYLLSLVPGFTEAGVSKLVVHYDGCGDGGEIENVLIYDGTGDKPLEFADGENLDKIKDAAYEVLEGQHGGWEINAGSFGDVILDVTENQVRIEHNWRIEDTEYEEHIL